MIYEHRDLMEPVEFKTEGKALVAHGYAARFDKLSQNLGGYLERVAPGAFAKTIKEQDIRALFNHNEDAVLGRLKAGTLRLSEDSDGLRYEIDLPDTSAGRDLAVSLERGDISGSSFGFRIVEDEWSDPEVDKGFPVRSLKQVSLRDVGPVTFPAYTDSESGLRSFAEHRSLDYALVVAAAKAGDLRTLLTPPGDQTADETDEGREQPTFTRHNSSLI